MAFEINCLEKNENGRFFLLSIFTIHEMLDIYFSLASYQFKRFFVPLYHSIIIFKTNVEGVCVLALRTKENISTFCERNFTFLPHQPRFKKKFI
jgi:hypothetical protein